MLIRIPDEKRVYLNDRVHAIKIIEPNTKITQVFKSMWHPIVSQTLIERQLGEPLQASNWVSRVLYYVKTNDGKEGFIMVPKYYPEFFYRQYKDSNPHIYFMYEGSSKGLYYFK